jgi:chromatin remodeling complex protein RSC6
MAQWTPPNKNIQSLFEFIPTPIPLSSTTKRKYISKPKPATEEYLKELHEQWLLTRDHVTKLGKMISCLQKKNMVTETKDTTAIVTPTTILPNKSKAKRVRAPNQKPRGFAIPCQASPDLCQFMGVTENTLIARTDALRAVHTYIKEKSIPHPAQDNRRILPDETLTHLFSFKANETTATLTTENNSTTCSNPLIEGWHREGMSYFEIPRYLYRHFPQASK